MKTENNFEKVILPHLEAAYGLGMWLTRDHDETEDIVQEAVLKAFTNFAQLRTYPRAWFLSIVRNTYYSRYLQKGNKELVLSNESIVFRDLESKDHSPEERLLRSEELANLYDCIDSLDSCHRQIINLREFDNLSYQQIARVLSIPLGTVMSRLARARRHLRSRMVKVEA